MEYYSVSIANLQCVITGINPEDVAFTEITVIDKQMVYDFYFFTISKIVKFIGFKSEIVISRD